MCSSAPTGSCCCGVGSSLGSAVQPALTVSPGAQNILAPSSAPRGVEILLSCPFFSTAFLELRWVTVIKESTDFIGLEVKLLLL